jgi:hypothetical protein
MQAMDGPGTQGQGRLQAGSYRGRDGVHGISKPGGSVGASFSSGTSMLATG